MEIPYYIIGIMYLVGLLVYMFFMSINVYHLVRFGMMDAVIKAHVILMLSLTGIIILFTVLLVLQVDWFDSFELFEVTSFDTNLFSNEQDYQ